MRLFIFILTITTGTGAQMLVATSSSSPRIFSPQQMFDRRHHRTSRSSDRIPIVPTNFASKPSSNLHFNSNLKLKTLVKNNRDGAQQGKPIQMEMANPFRKKINAFFQNKTRHNELKMEEKRWLQNFTYKRKKVGEYRYDEELAKKICALSGAAYQDPNDPFERDLKIIGLLQRLFPESDWEFGNFLESKCHLTGFHEAFFYSMSKANKELILTFRGTMNNFQLLRQFVDSLNRKVQFDEENEEKLVNKYFLDAHQQLWGHVKEILEKHKDFSVTFHGHSLGGALASLAAVQSVQDRILDSQNVRHYTFGQPRVGNFAFASYFDTLIPNSFRVVNGQDPIPHWPLLGYGHDGAYHHSTEIWYSEGMVDGHFQICNGEPSNEDPECSDQFEINKNPLLMAQFGGHHTENFIWCEDL